jgi:hypothetical protein
VKRLFFYVATAAFALASVEALHAPAHAQGAATPPPPPPAPTASATPQAQVTLPPGATPAPKGTATPAPPKDPDVNRVGISGVWEVAIQNPSEVVYTHFKLEQKGTVLTGTYLDTSGKRYPLTGTIDGKNVRVVVTLPNGSALVFNGTEDGGMDMIGTLDNAKDTVGFTASYRPKYKWIDNLSPGAGGMGNGIP